MKKFILQIVFVVIVSFGLVLIVWAAWTPPGSPPPGGNVPAPINVGNVSQTKTGDLTLSNLYLNATALEGDILAVDELIGYNDLILRGNLSNNAPIYLNMAGGELRVLGWDPTNNINIDNMGSSGNLYIGRDQPGDVIIGDSDSGSTPPTLLFIRKSDGNVGIGTASPGEKLDVEGNIKIRGGSLYGSSNRKMLGESGNWLYLNPNSDYSNGVYSFFDFQVAGDLKTGQALRAGGRIVAGNNGDDPVIGMGNGDIAAADDIYILGDTYMIGGKLYGSSNRKMLSENGDWLYLNPDNHYPKGVYTPYDIQAAGDLRTGQKIVAGNNGIDPVPGMGGGDIAAADDIYLGKSSKWLSSVLGGRRVLYSAMSAYNDILNTIIRWNTDKMIGSAIGNASFNNFIDVAVVFVDVPSDAATIKAKVFGVFSTNGTAGSREARFQVCSVAGCSGNWPTISNTASWSSDLTVPNPGAGIQIINIKAEHIGLWSDGAGLYGFIIWAE